MYINKRTSKLGIWGKGLGNNDSAIRHKNEWWFVKRKRLRAMWCMSMGSLSMGSLNVCIKKKKEKIQMHTV